MWISRKKFQALEKRIADLEGQVQSQLSMEIDVNAIHAIHAMLRTLEASHDTGVKDEVS